MAAQHEMTWFAPRRCWKKKHRSRVYYSPIECKGKSDWDGYKASLTWWEKKRSELDGEFQRQKQSEVMVASGAELEAIGLAAQRRGDYEDATKPSYEDWQEQREAVVEVRRQRQTVDKAQTVDAFAGRFLDFKRSQAVAGQKSPGRFVNLRTYVNQFTTFVGREKALSGVNFGIVLSDYYQRQLNAVEKAEVSETTARDRMQVARQFIRRCWELGAVELPRNLDSKEMTIAASSNEIELFDFKDLKRIIKDAPEQWAEYYPLKLYLLLMANCGMTQKDIADLLVSQVDFKDGIIRRKRSKKQKRFEGNVPTVQYKLWPLTVKLLRTYRSTGSARVLVNREGGLLNGTTLNPDAASRKASKVDFIADAYNDWVEQKDVKGAKSLKAIRKTSASQLEKHSEYARYAQFFLCQSAKTVADKHYVVPSQDRFDASIKWLGEQCGQGGKAK